MKIIVLFVIIKYKETTKLIFKFSQLKYSQPSYFRITTENLRITIENFRIKTENLRNITELFGRPFPGKKQLKQKSLKLFQNYRPILDCKSRKEMHKKRSARLWRDV